MEIFSCYIVELYNSVLVEQITRFSVDQKDVQIAIRHMKDAYQPFRNWQNRAKVPIIASYDDAAHQCAYLHKHAMCYAGMVNHFINSAVRDSNILACFLGTKATINICSLGGGPGTDAIAISEAFVLNFNHHRTHIRVIDYFKKWEEVFTSVIKELQTGLYGTIKESVLPQYFTYEYIQADLLESFSPRVKEAIRSSDFVSMVKFISAAACCRTETMVKEVFNSMKPGAFLLFIDNAAGGFLTMVQKVAKKCDMLRIFGPITHYKYKNDAYSLTRYGYKSQSETRVSVQMWMKPLRQLETECEVLVEPQLGSHSYQKSLGRGIESHEQTGQLKAECGILIEPELVVHSHQNSLSKGEHKQEPPGKLKTDWEFLVEHASDFNPNQNSSGRDLGSQKPLRQLKAERDILIEPELVIHSSQKSLSKREHKQEPSRKLKTDCKVSVEPELDNYFYQNSSRRGVGLQKSPRPLKAESESLVEPELDFFSYQISSGRYLESQEPSFTTLPRTEDSADAPYIAEKGHSANSVASEKSEEDEQVCCCTVI